jgi:RNA recognition motif-containing protein
MADVLNMALGDVIKSTKEGKIKNKKDFKKSPKKVEKAESSRKIKKISETTKVNLPTKAANNNKKANDILSRIGNNDTVVEIHNLKYSITDDEVKKLCTLTGQVVSCTIHRRHDGTSSGSAHAIFKRKEDAIRFVNEFNGKTFDDRPMRIKLGDSRDHENNERSVSIIKPGNKPKVIKQNNDDTRVKPAKKGSKSFKKESKSEADLDADLDSYGKN